MIQVGIDITSTIYNRGVSRYTTNLVRGLLQHPDLKMTLYGSSLRQRQQLLDIAEELKKESNAKAETVIQSYPPSLYNFLWNKLRFPKLKSVMPNVQLFHSWDWLQPPDSDLPLVSTIHDLAILKYPETAHPKVLDMHKQSWKILKERKAMIIAVSRATKRDIVELLQIPEQLVKVVHEALPVEVQRVSQSITDEKLAEIKVRLDLTRPFILCVGTREPRKNIKNLIEAWLPMQKDIDLIVAGESGWDETDAKEYQTLSPHLRFLGRVTDEELSVLYSESSLFAYPSLYEGFGLPILEAFYHGTPVLTSNVSSMPEVAGNAAELVDPMSIESIRTGIENILNETEDEQQKRIQKMIIRQQMFNWPSVVKETVAAYKQALTLSQG
ncbi:MAG: hypothetical protein QG639_207 [Patescibacteria group bacterium]|jgi:glycosyltransferase involved in cell wall biosynthesis|nr:hypothetical protein [Patescibacteria group bacterium]